MKIKRFDDLNESKKEKSIYEFGCVFVRLNIAKWDDITSVIDKKDLYEPKDPAYGISKDPHITILYGLHDDVTDKDVKEICDEIDREKIDIKVNGIGIFECPDYDVVKIELESKYLAKFNKKLAKLPYTSDYKNQYNPHITLAYVEKGKGKKYVDKDFTIDFNTISDVYYSHIDNSETRIKI